MDAQKDIDLLLIGKTGNGKSATGNSILRNPTSFKAMPTTQSVTTQIHFDYSIFQGRTIKVVDGPGVGDTRMSDEEALKMVQDRLKFAITANPDGYHAFLLVVRYGGRFTREDVQTIDSLKKIFGMDFVKNFCIIIITCGDNLENDIEETGMDFNQWLQAQEGVFRDISKECQGRVILFNNKTKDGAVKNSQVGRLLSIVDSLGGRRYTDENFEKAKALREKQMIEAKEPRVREETLKETAVLMQMLENIKLGQPESQIGDLADVMTRANNLYQSVQSQDKGTGALKYSLEAARSIVTQVKSQSEYCKKLIADRKRFEEQQEKIQQDFDAKLEQQNIDYENRLQEVRAMEERRREEERAAMEKRLKEEREEEEKRQQERFNALRIELEQRSEQERLQREREFQQMVEREAKEASKKRKKEKRKLEEKLERENEEAEERRRKKAKQRRKEQEAEKKEKEEERKRLDEENERKIREEKERHEKELQKEKEKAEEARRRAKDAEENLIVTGVKKVWEYIKPWLTGGKKEKPGGCF